MITVNDRAAIRHAYYVDHKSIRQIARELGFSRNTVKKALESAERPRYTQRVPRQAPKLDAYRQRIDELFQQNGQLPPKQRYTATRIFQIVQAEGFTGSASTVRAYVGQLRQQHQRPRTFLPLQFDPGQDAQVDWGEAQVDLAGTRVTVQVFVMTLCYSHRTFVMAVPTQRQEAFLAGHEAAFRFFGGVPHRISYDNLTTALQICMQGRTRPEQETFTLFRSHALFASHFCTPDEPQEKGRVEHRVGFSRRTYFVPIPQVDTYADLNTHLLACCQRDDVRIVHGETQSIGAAWQHEQPLLRPLPSHPFDYAVTHTVRLNRYSQVCFETNRYSVPVDQARPTLVLKASPFTIDLLTEEAVIASHLRCYDRHQDILNPLHYLPLLQQRPGAFRHAKPLRQWRERWPPDYERLLRRFQERHPDGLGVREFITVLQLHQRYPAELVAEAIAFAVTYGCSDAASVLALLHQLQQTPQPTAAVDVSAHPHVQHIAAQPLDLQQYDRLLSQGEPHDHPSAVRDPSDHLTPDGHP